MNVRNARVEQAVEPFYQPENFELQLIRTHDSSLDRGVHRRCVTACCQDTASFCTPVAHETTMLVMGPGRYRFKHYLSIGSGMAVIAWLLTTFVTPLVWRF